MNLKQYSLVINNEDPKNGEYKIVKFCMTEGGGTFGTNS
jgi:hypothetical protein